MTTTLGYDRPLKPEWIYKTLRGMEAGQKPETYYAAYNDIAVELTGEVGRRKTRTVLYRTFIFSFQENTKLVEDNMLLRLCKEQSLDFMKPILLSKFIMDYAILQFFTEKFYQIFDTSQQFSSTAISAKMIEQYGDIKHIKRSTRSFLKTLCDFDIIEAIDTTNFNQLPKLELSPEQVKEILKLYAATNHTKQIDIQNIDKTIFAYYQQPNLDKVANLYHSSEWEYIKGVDRGLLMLG
jgi:hypothetical protein